MTASFHVSNITGGNSSNKNEKLKTKLLTCCYS